MIKSKVYNGDRHYREVRVNVQGDHDDIAAELGCIFEHFYENDALFKIFLETMDSFIRQKDILEK